MKNNIITVNYPASNAITFVLPHDGTTQDILEVIFGKFNHGSGQECKEFIQHNLRSLSVNDFVRVNGVWYQCLSVGWKERAEAFVDDIEKRVVEHPDYTLHGDWFALNSVMFAVRQEIGESIVD